MQFVEPIRDIKKLAQIKNLLRGEGNVRDLLLFELGVNSALRCSDLLALRIRDVFAPDGSVLDSFEVREKKTGKRSKVSITPKVRTTLAEYRRAYPEVCGVPENFLFFARKSYPLGSEHIRRGQSWRIIRRTCESVGLTGRFGNHSLRKTFGFQARQHAIPIELVQYRLNHSSLAVTKRYLGIRDEELAEACNKMDL